MRDVRYTGGQQILTAPDVPDSDITIRNYVLPRRNRETGKIEKHMPLGNYIGPMTDVIRRLNEGVLPTTRVDRGAMNHDVAYYNIRTGLRNGTITIPKAEERVRQADNVLIAEAQKTVLAPLNATNSSHGIGAMTGMKLKKVAEDVGLLDPLKFIGKGKLRKIKGVGKDPLSKLRKSMAKGMIC